MITKRLGIAATVLVLDTLLLLIVGAKMWAEPPSSADEATGTPSDRTVARSQHLTGVG